VHRSVQTREKDWPEKNVISRSWHWRSVNRLNDINEASRMPIFPAHLQKLELVSSMQPKIVPLAGYKAAMLPKYPCYCTKYVFDSRSVHFVPPRRSIIDWLPWGRNVLMQQYGVRDTRTIVQVTYCYSQGEKKEIKFINLYLCSRTDSDIKWMKIKNILPNNCGLCRVAGRCVPPHLKKGLA
jgi:hypothetical protein